MRINVLALLHYENSFKNMDFNTKFPCYLPCDEGKTWEQVDQEIQSFLQPIKEATSTPHLAASRENLG